MESVIVDFSNDIYHTLLDHLDVGVYFVDAQRRILSWNAGAEKITGYKSMDVVGTACWEDVLTHVDDKGVNLCKTGCPLLSTITDGEERISDVYLHHREGHRLPVRVRTVPLRDGHGKIVGGIESFTDQTSAKIDMQTMQSLARLAYIDQVTGMSNQNHMRVKLETVYREWEEYATEYGVILVRIVNHADILKLYGSDVAKSLIKVASKTVSGATRSCDVYGRWDETGFMIIAMNATLDHINVFREKYRRLLERSTLSVGRDRIAMICRTDAIIPDEDEDEDFPSFMSRVEKQ